MKPTNLSGRNSRIRFAVFVLGYALLILSCFIGLQREDGLSMGRKPWENLAKTVTEFARPSFLDVWQGKTRLEYRSDDGTILRTENRQLVEVEFLKGLARATWTTFEIGTLGSLFGAILALPLGVVAARNMAAPAPLAWLAKLILDAARSVHSLVFGLILVGIVGLGPTAGILAIGLHSLGTYGKLYAESIETLDMASIMAVRAVGAGPLQTFFNAVWPAVLPQWLSSHLYIWEYNVRDSTVLGLIGAGGLGLLISEAVSLFQWGRLASILLVVIAMVFVFDAISRKVRQGIL